MNKKTKEFIALVIGVPLSAIVGISIGNRFDNPMLGVIISLTCWIVWAMVFMRDEK